MARASQLDRLDPRTPSTGQSGRYGGHEKGKRMSVSDPEHICSAELYRLFPWASKNTIARMIQRGTLPKPLPWPGRKRVWRRAEVLAFLATLNASGATAEGAGAQ